MRRQSLFHRHRGALPVVWWLRPHRRPAMKVLVCGSRDWTDEGPIADRLATLAPDGCATLIHGAARGADTIASNVADLLGWAVHQFPADWDRHGKRAGILRNL